MEEQRRKNTEAEQLEARALKARGEAKVAAGRIQRCQSSLQAAEDKLAAKKHEISHKVGPSVIQQIIPCFTYACIPAV